MNINDYINPYYDGEGFTVDFDPEHIRVVYDPKGTIEFLLRDQAPGKEGDA